MRIGSTRGFILVSISFTLITLSLFLIPMYTGAIDTTNKERCDACHVIENDEFSRSGVHNTIRCSSCHKIDEFMGDLYTHTATTFACIYCHINQNDTAFYNDAHNNFSNASNASDIFTGQNEMCIACHTGIDLKIEWHRYNGTNMEVSASRKGWVIKYTSLFGDNVTTNQSNYTDYLNSTLNNT